MALERAGRDSTVFVHLSHGMRAHYDGACLLDPVLWRLDQYLSGEADRGWLSRAADLALTPLPSSARGAVLSRATALGRRYADRFPAGHFEADLPSLAQRRWWMQPNDTVCGSVRLNVEGREPHGLIRPHRARDAAAWLAERLLELVNLGHRGAGGPSGVPDRRQLRARRRRRLRRPHRRVEPRRAHRVRVVACDRRSPGALRRLAQRRSSLPRGCCWPEAPGIRPGLRPAQMPVIDVAPTVCRVPSTSTLRDIDGLRWPGLEPPERPPLVDRPVPRLSPRRRWSREVDVPLVRWTQQFAVGLAGAHHHTASIASRADGRCRGPRGPRRRPRTVGLDLPGHCLVATAGRSGVAPGVRRYADARPRRPPGSGGRLREGPELRALGAHRRRRRIERRDPPSCSRP